MFHTVYALSRKQRIQLLLLHYFSWLIRVLNALTLLLYHLVSKSRVMEPMYEGDVIFLFWSSVSLAVAVFPLQYCLSRLLFDFGS